MGLLTTILNLFVSEALSIWSKVSGALTTIVNEIPDDEVTILHDAMNAAAEALKGGASVEEAFTAGLNTFAAEEKAELSKVGMALLQAFVYATAPKN